MPSRNGKRSGSTRRGAARRKTSTPSSDSSAGPPAKTPPPARTTPKVQTVAHPSKKPKPTFDVARDPIADSKSGWVYRSDPAPASPVTPFGPVVRDVPPAHVVAPGSADVDRFQPHSP